MMGNLPLHPMLVHFPLVLAAAAPIVAIICVWRIQRGARVLPVWSAVVALAALLGTASFIAVRSGEAEEDKVESVVGKDVLQKHEEAGERFLYFTIAFFVIAGVGLVKGGIGKGARSLTAASSIALVLAAVKVGEAGGELVYVHGAASAYQTSANVVPKEMEK